VGGFSNWEYRKRNCSQFFRHITDYVSKNQDYYDVTLTGISRFTEDKRIEFIKTATNWSDKVKTVLRPLLLFPDLPALHDWKRFLDDLVVKDDWQKLSIGVSKTFWHQSEEATYCRWIKLLCEIVVGKIKFSSTIEGINDTIKGVLEYPNYGDLRHIRPIIRASEIGIPMDPKNKNGHSEWSRKFWQYCFEQTECIPEEIVSERIKK